MMKVTIIAVRQHGKAMLAADLEDPRTQALLLLLKMHPQGTPAARRLQVRQTLNLAGVTLCELAEVVTQAKASGLTLEQLQLKFNLILQPEDVAA